MDYELPLHILRAVRKFEPIAAEGLILYPVRVAEYEEFLTARPALEVLQQAFPAPLLRIPLLSALYRMDYEAASRGEEQSGLFSRALLLLALSLRLGEGLDLRQRVRKFRIAADPKDPAKLLYLQASVDGEEMLKITPVKFQQIRPIIAAQNGVKLESDLANPDLVEAEREMAGLNAPKMDADVEHLISGVAAMSGTDEAEIDDWPILKLNRRAESFKRVMDYVICGIGEAQGTKWKNGNPAPHPFFDRAEEGFSAVTPVSEFGSGVMGERK